MLGALLALALPAAASQDARVARIENGLLPAVVVEGSTAVPMALRARMLHHRVPGVGIAFIDQGRVAWTRSYGHADAAGRPVKADTLFQAASLSKPVAAVAALRLAQEGRLALDEDVNLRLRSWKVPENGFTREKKVTLRGLLSHSAGLTVDGFSGYAGGAPVPTLLQVLDGLPPANSPAVRVSSVPGTVYAYSGGGYTVLQQLLEDVGGKPFPELLNELVLRPAGMKDSFFGALGASDRGRAALPHGSAGYAIPGGAHVYPELAAAGLWTTPTDLARLALQLLRAIAGKTDGVLSPATAKAMMERQVGDRGLGFGLAPAGRRSYFRHGGSNAGYKCVIFVYADGQGVVLMSNGDGGGDLNAEILRAVAAEYGWPDHQPKRRSAAPLAPDALAAYEGVFELPEKDTATVQAVDGRLFLRADAWKPYPLLLLPASATEFFTVSPEASVGFRLGADGRAGALLLPGPVEGRRVSR